jgi:hypothetical protein
MLREAMQIRRANVTGNPRAFDIDGNRYAPLLHYARLYSMRLKKKVVAHRPPSGSSA